MGTSKSRVYKAIEAYNNKVPEWNVGKKRGGYREERAYLTLREEKALLDSLAEEAIKGIMLTNSHIKKKVEQKVGKKVSDDYIRDLFKRHSWKKKASPPPEYYGDMEKQEEYNKTVSKYWYPPS